MLVQAAAQMRQAGVVGRLEGVAKDHEGGGIRERGGTGLSPQRLDLRLRAGKMRTGLRAVKPVRAAQDQTEQGEKR